MFKTTNPDNYVGVEDSIGLAAIFLVFHNSSQVDILWKEFLQFCILEEIK